ncbi:hypothetical protein GCM10023084_20530 [Streptomyces lacrimifluminis]|uniref:Uncharacterized protein n=1 Tax=Streptomyces lacrimifluminis TaxID=1500077 RepID=A0A917NWF0_9ACTN|nr:hypothetical protein GCM10012282_34740 [Streptomyces lacrimifluminis]
MAAAVPVRESWEIRVVRAAGRRVMRPELEEEVSGIATGLVAAMALVALSPESAMTELRRSLKEILQREGLSPGEIAYLWERSRTGRRDTPSNGPSATRTAWRRGRPRRF